MVDRAETELRESAPAADRPRVYAKPAVVRTRLDAIVKGGTTVTFNDPPTRLRI